MTPTPNFNLNSRTVTRFIHGDQIRPLRGQLSELLVSRPLGLAAFPVLSAPLGAGSLPCLATGWTCLPLFDHFGCDPVLHAALRGDCWPHQTGFSPDGGPSPSPTAQARAYPSRGLARLQGTPGPGVTSNVDSRIWGSRGGQCARPHGSLRGWGRYWGQSPRFAMARVP